MGYGYQVIVTNIENVLPERLWRLYNGRANVEKMIKEGVTPYSLDVNIIGFCINGINISILEASPLT